MRPADPRRRSATRLHQSQDQLLRSDDHLAKLRGLGSGLQVLLKVLAFEGARYMGKKALVDSRR
jgi:hypothetical protein